MCCRGLGAAAASILSQNLELQGFFREVEREREREREREKEREREREREKADTKNHGQRRDAQLVNYKFKCDFSIFKFNQILL